MPPTWFGSAVAAAASLLVGCPAPAPYDCGRHGDCDAGPADGLEADGPEADGPDIDAPDLDRDDDGVVDADDICPDDADPDQHDEDGDGRGDVCDVCPHVADPSQVNLDGDGLGDACDPRPANPRNQLVLFDPFSPASVAPWVAADGTWTPIADTLRVSASSAVSRIARPITVPPLLGLVVETRVVIMSVPATPGIAYVGVGGPVDFGVGTGEGCALYDNTANTGNMEAMFFQVTGDTLAFSRVALFNTMLTPITATLTHTRTGSARCDVAVGAEERGASYMSSGAPVTSLGLVGRNVTASYQYLIAYTD